jgi:hypothetical protein
MTWIRAIWIENAIEEEGVVPKAWIQGKTVRWPIGMNVLRAFNEQKEPSEDWHKFPLMKIKLTSGLFPVLLFQIRVYSFHVGIN